MFPFYFAFSFPLFYFRSLNPDPDICPFSATLTWFSSILICSEPHVCSSVWNWHWLSLKFIIWTSKPSPVSRPKFKDSRCLVAQHISWSRVLAEHIEPWYALGPSPAHNNLAHYMPDVTAFTTPLSGCAQNNRPFIWTPLLDKFESIKSLACRAPILTLWIIKNIPTQKSREYL